MQTIRGSYNGGLEDLELCIITDVDDEPVTATGVESEDHPGHYAFSFADDVTGTLLPCYYRRGVRTVAGNAVVTMPGAGGEAWINGRASTPAPVVLPALSTVNLEPLPGRQLTGYTGGGYTQSITVLDSNRDPINLAGKNLQAVLMDAEETMIGEPVTPTISGASSNVVTFNAPAAWHETAGEFLYAVWDLNDVTLGEPRPWARGCYKVALTARPVV